MNELDSIVMIPSRAGGAWAVGSSAACSFCGLDGSRRRPLIERWNGYRWSRVTVWEPQIASQVDAVSALSASSAFAVGDWSRPTLNASWPMAEEWNGTAWKFEAMPAPSGQGATLSGVVELSSTDVWAVGHLEIDKNTGVALLAHYNGTRWAYVAAPRVSGQTGAWLESVHRIPGSNVLIAVGRAAIGVNGPLVPVVMRYNGSSWSLIQAPAGTQALSDIAILSPSDYWVVGGGPAAFASEWSGSSWSANSMPPTVAGVGALARVPDTTTLWAVGLDRAYRDITVYYDGSSWHTVSTPYPPAIFNSLRDVAAANPTNAWAVGVSFLKGGPATTLILHYH